MAHSAGYYLGEGTKTLVPMTVARVAVAPGDSTSSLRESATATRRWTREETRAKATSGPEFTHPSPDRPLLDELVRGYEQITGTSVRRPGQRNLIAACYRVHGDDFLRLVREWFERNGTTVNLLGELRVLPQRLQDLLHDDDEPRVVVGHLSRQPLPLPAQSGADQPSQADSESAWCGCPEEDLRPDLLYCTFHRPVYQSAPTRRYDRRSSNPDAARFFATAGQPESSRP
jgi:hypothetical protein